jgi:hypothetical protein
MTKSNPAVCVTNFTFLSATAISSKVIPIYGLVGLAPDDPTNPPSIVAALYNQGLIQNKMFGFMFGPSPFPS